MFTGAGDRLAAVVDSQGSAPAVRVMQLSFRVAAVAAGSSPGGRGLPFSSYFSRMGT
jgi:hypothetical protein